MSNKISVIGGSGFVGTNLCRELCSKNIDFEILDLKISTQFPEKCKIADVRDATSLRKNITGDIVVNLAAVHRDDVINKNEYNRTNVEGAENITAVCIEKEVNKIVFTSTVAVYGFVRSPTDETGKIQPFNEYGRSKFQAEEIFQNWQRKTHKSLVIIRPTVIFGEGNRGNVFNLFRQIANDKFVMIGNGTNKKSIAYVENVAAFLEQCISTDKYVGVFNYVDTPNLTMNELVSIVRYKLKGKSKIGLHIPYVLAVFIGFVADFISLITKKNLLISSIRVRKFCSSTEFISSRSNHNDFIPPLKLSEAIERTLHNEFVNPDISRETFYTE